MILHSLPEMMLVPSTSRNTPGAIRPRSTHPRLAPLDTVHRQPSQLVDGTQHLALERDEFRDMTLSAEFNSTKVIRETSGDGLGRSRSKHAHASTFTGDIELQRCSSSTRNPLGDPTASGSNVSPSRSTFKYGPSEWIPMILLRSESDKRTIVPI